MTCATFGRSGGDTNSYRNKFCIIRIANEWQHKPLNRLDLLSLRTMRKTKFRCYSINEIHVRHVLYSHSICSALNLHMHREAITHGKEQKIAQCIPLPQSGCATICEREEKVRETAGTTRMAVTASPAMQHTRTKRRKRYTLHDSQLKVLVDQLDNLPARIHKHGNGKFG